MLPRGDAFPPVRLQDQLACLEREIRLRREVYPRWVQTGRMKQATADEELRRMTAVHGTVKDLAAAAERLVRAWPDCDPWRPHGRTPPVVQQARIEASRAVADMTSTVMRLVPPGAANDR